MGLLRTLAIIILFYYGFKFLARFIFPYFAKFLIKKAQQNMHNQYDGSTQHKKEEGKVTINTNPHDKQGHHKVDAEDVDFEEIKE